MRWDDDGALVVEARLSAEDGALFIKALDAAVDSSDRPKDVTAVTSDTPTEPEPLSARRADALVDLAETYLAEGYREGNAGERYQVQVVVEGKALSGVVGSDDTACCEAEAALAPARPEDGPAIALETARRIACDASVVPLVEAADGSVLDVGRRTRSIPPAIQRGVRRRDGGWVLATLAAEPGPWGRGGARCARLGGRLAPRRLPPSARPRSKGRLDGRDAARAAGLGWSGMRSFEPTEPKKIRVLELAAAGRGAGLTFVGLGLTPAHLGAQSD